MNDRRRRTRLVRRLSAAAAAVGAATLLLAAAAEDVPHRPGAPLADAPPVTVPLPLPPREKIAEAPVRPAAQRPSRERILEVRRGDSLWTVLRRAGVPAATVTAIARLPTAAPLARLRPGDRLAVEVKGGDLRLLRYTLDERRTLRLERKADGRLQATVEKAAVEVRLARAHGTVRSSLFEAARAAGLSERLTMRLAEIFGWDIDFALDIRAGDRFTVVYEQIYREGEYLRDGDIVAAEFVNRGKRHRAVRFATSDGRTDYYDPQGRSLRKAFLRAPVDFRRITSRFRRERRHPVLGVRRPHRGVDYAAAIGTPVRATGDGRVVHAGWRGGYGKTVILRHGTTYTTLYAHMSRIARGIRKGVRVRQGQIIGYVGKTGLTTGPHLHYEFRVNGVHRNPLTVPLPQARPLPAAEREAFARAARPLLAQLDLMERFALALAGR